MTLSDLQPLYSRCCCADSTFPNLSIMEVASLPLRDHCWGARDSLDGEQHHPFPHVSKLHTERTQCVLKNQATASSHHLCHWPCGLPQFPKLEINPPAKPKLLSDRFGHWINSPRGPIKWQLVREEHRECTLWSRIIHPHTIPLVALSAQPISNLKLLPQTSFSHHLGLKKSLFFESTCIQYLVSNL